MKVSQRALVSVARGPCAAHLCLRGVPCGAGVGQLLVTALFFRLYGMVLNVVFVIIVLASLLVDVLSAASDPRVRFG